MGLNRKKWKQALNLICNYYGWLKMSCLWLSEKHKVDSRRTLYRNVFKYVPSSCDWSHPRPRGRGGGRSEQGNFGVFLCLREFANWWLIDWSCFDHINALKRLIGSLRTWFIKWFTHDFFYRGHVYRGYLPDALKFIGSVSLIFEK